MNINKILKPKIEDGKEKPEYKEFHDVSPIAKDIKIPTTSTINIEEVNKVIQGILNEAQNGAKAKKIEHQATLEIDKLRNKLIEEYKENIKQDARNSNKFKIEHEEKKLYIKSQFLPKWQKYLEYLKMAPEENTTPLNFEKSLKGMLMYIWNVIRFKSESHWQEIIQEEINKEKNKREKMKESAMEERLNFVKLETAYIHEATQKRCSEIDNDPSIEKNLTVDEKDKDVILNREIEEYNLMRNPLKENLSNN